MTLSIAPSALESFAEFESYINGESKSFLHSLRQNAMASFNALGLPRSTVEEWKYTKAASLAHFTYRPHESDFDFDAVEKAVLVERKLLKAKQWLVMVNGRYFPNLSHVSHEDKVRVGSLRDCFSTHQSCMQSHFAHYVSTEKNGLIALNAAFMNGGIYLHVEKNTTLSETVHLISVSTTEKIDSAFCPRVLAVIGDKSSLSLVESHVSVGENSYLSNFVCEVVVGAQSTFKHLRMVKEAPQACHVAHYGIRQEKGSNYKFWNFSLSGKLVRQEICSDLAGAGAFFNFRGLDIGSDDQHIDTCLLAHHSQPFGTSAQLVKGIFQGRSTGVFNGKIFVCEGADKTDALQVNKNLMLSAEAQTFTRPQLEIYADDVKCAHGATVGKLDNKALFYLQARGIAKKEAEIMLAQAFVEEVLDDVDATFLEVLKKVIRGRLAHA